MLHSSIFSLSFEFLFVLFILFYYTVKECSLKTVANMATKFKCLNTFCLSEKGMYKICSGQAFRTVPAAKGADCITMVIGKVQCPVLLQP